MVSKSVMAAKIKRAANTLVSELKPEKIILFGSYAWGKAGPDSDVDLFIVKETGNTRDMARKISRFVFPRPFPMDIVVYRPERLLEAQKRDFFINDVLKKGRVLYG